MIVSASNRTALAVARQGKTVTIVVLPAHEADGRLDELAAALPEGATMDLLSPTFCDTFAEAVEILRNHGGGASS